MSMKKLSSLVCVFQNSQMVVDDLDVGFETEYPSRMSDSEFLVNQCYQFHNVNT